MPFMACFCLKPSLWSHHDMGLFPIHPFLLPKFQHSLIFFRNTSSPHNPSQNPIINAYYKHDIYILHLITYLFHFVSNPTNRALNILLVTTNSCFFITPNCNLNNLINLPNQVPHIGHAVYVNFFSSLEKWHPPSTTLQININWPMKLVPSA